MFGRDWEPAQARIVATHVKNTSGDGSVLVHEYAADVTPASGVVFRALIQEPTIATDFWPPQVGAVVKVLVDGAGGGGSKVKFDKSDPQISYKAHRHRSGDSFDAVLAQPPDAPATAPVAWSMPSLVVPAAPAAPDPAARLRRLESLKEQGLITDAEYAQKRQAIIDGV